MADYRLPFTGEQVEEILSTATPQSSLTQETQRATEAEGQLQSNITAEAETRGNADLQLQQHIDAEAQTRSQADVTLQGNIDAEETRAKAAEKANADDIDVIEGKIPAAASDQNQLADKQFVNSSIQTATAEFKGTFNEVSDLHLTVSATRLQIAAALPNVVASANNNDYAFVQIPVADATPTVIASVERYKYNGSQWLFEYALNNSGFTQAQWDALNSGITSGLVTKLSALPTNAELTTLLAGKQAVIVDLQDIREGAAAGATAVQPAALQSEAETRAAADTALGNRVTTIEGKIPVAASPQNQLADKQYVDDGISTATAEFKGAYNLVTDLHLTITATRSEIATELGTVISGADNNDYAYVQIPVANDAPTTIAKVERYKYNGSAWGFEYELNNSGFTAAQWDAINSGITSGLVSKLSDLPTLAQLSVLLNGKQNTLTFDTAPTEGSSNPVTSAGIFSGIASAIAAALTAYYTKAQTYSQTEVQQLISTTIASYYTKSEVDALIANFITASVNNLVNYYLKSETFTKAEVNQLIAAVQQFTYQSVAELPTASADTMNKIYLVPSTNPETKNVKDEYITIATTDQGTTTYSWEQIGSTTVDLSGYSTTEQMNAAIANAITTALANYYTKSQTMTSAEIEAAISAALLTYSTTSEMNTAISNAINTALASYSTTTQMTAAIATAIANYYTKAEVDALIANFITKSVNDLTYYYLKSETYTQAEINQLIAAVQQFTYQSVAELPTASADTMNKIYLVPSTNPETKNVKDEYITISVTDQGTTTYSWEQIGSTTVDLSGYYTSAQTDAAISNALNTALASYSTTTQMTAAIATAIANYYTKAEVDALIANFITKAVSDLTYYYLKSETYNKTEVDAMVAAIQQFQLISVQTLPTASADTMNKIYLVPGTDPQTQNIKDEYITLEVTDQGTTTYSWECIGSTEISLDNYYTKSQTDNAISGAITLALADYSTTSQVGTIVSTAITTALANYYTKTQVDNELTKKTDKLTMTGAGAAVEDDIMVIDKNGNIKDGGKKISDLQLKVTDCAMLGGGFPTCATAGGTAAKTVSIDHFLLLPNCRISVLFQNAFTASNPTLSINGGTAIAIKHFGRAMEIGKVHANTILTMVYDGTYWQVVGIEGITGSTPSGAVDLALPSGLLWCEHNVGAASPYDDGLYFSWGNVEGHTGTDGYDFGTGNDGPYASTPGAALTGNISVDGTYDAARHNMGAPWRMPTVGEFQELNSNCTSEWTDEDGVAGRRFTSNINGNSIFFPASGSRYGTSLNLRGSGGYYWSSSLYSSAGGYHLYFSSGGVNPANNNSRFYGFSVRAVQ